MKESDLDPYQIEKQDPDRYQSEKQDPDTDQKDLHPQYWLNEVWLDTFIGQEMVCQLFINFLTLPIIFY